MRIKNRCRLLSLEVIEARCLLTAVASSPIEPDAAAIVSQGAIDLVDIQLIGNDGGAAKPFTLSAGTNDPKRFIWLYDAEDRDATYAVISTRAPDDAQIGIWESSLFEQGGMLFDSTRGLPLLLSFGEFGLDSNSTSVVHGGFSSTEQRYALPSFNSSTNTDGSDGNWNLLGDRATEFPGNTNLSTGNAIPRELVQSTSLLNAPINNQVATEISNLSNVEAVTNLTTQNSQFEFQANSFVVSNQTILSQTTNTPNQPALRWPSPTQETAFPSQGEVHVPTDGVSWSQLASPPVGAFRVDGDQDAVVAATTVSSRPSPLQTAVLVEPSADRTSTLALQYPPARPSIPLASAIEVTFDPQSIVKDTRQFVNGGEQTTMLPWDDIETQLGKAAPKHPGLRWPSSLDEAQVPIYATTRSSVASGDQAAMTSATIVSLQPHVVAVAASPLQAPVLFKPLSGSHTSTLVLREPTDGRSSLSDPAIVTIEATRTSESQTSLEVVHHFLSGAEQTTSSILPSYDVEIPLYEDLPVFVLEHVGMGEMARGARVAPIDDEFVDIGDIELGSTTTYGAALNVHSVFVEATQIPAPAETNGSQTTSEVGSYGSTRRLEAGEFESPEKQASAFRPLDPTRSPLKSAAASLPKSWAVARARESIQFSSPILGGTETTANGEVSFGFSTSESHKFMTQTGTFEVDLDNIRPDEYHAETSSTWGSVIAVFCGASYFQSRRVARHEDRPRVETLRGDRN